MKVVLFCGGLGLRLRDFSEEIPKPMVPVGNHPILWHLMKYYAHYGHRKFVLCLGHKAIAIKKFFLNYNECLSNDFVLSNGGTQVELLHRDIADWQITFADTGMATNIGGRLLAVRKHVQDQDIFLANYSDNLSDADLSRITDDFRQSDAVAGFLCVQPNVTFHLVQSDPQNRVVGLKSAPDSELWSNGGFFIFRQEMFDYIHPGEDLVEQPFQRLIAQGRLRAYRHSGFWACMDTFKEKQQLDDLYHGGRPPWQVWNAKTCT